LEAGSPAINAGDETICAAPPVEHLDQRGFLRPGAGAADCSIGGYEFDAVLAPCGTFLTTWGSAGSQDGQFESPTGVAVDGSRNVYVAEFSRIQKFTNVGGFLLAFGWGVKDGMAAAEICTSECQSGLAGSGDAQFETPIGITFDGIGNIFVADTSNNRI